MGFTAGFGFTVQRVQRQDPLRPGRLARADRPTPPGREPGAVAVGWPLTVLGVAGRTGRVGRVVAAASSLAQVT